MDRFITNVQVEKFLEDFTGSSQTILLEEGKERNELEKIAKAKGMDIKNSKDLGIFKTIYAFTNEANSNGAILPKKEILRVLPQIIGKPININHERQFVVGHYIDFRYLQKKDMIVAYAVYYKSYYEDLWDEAKDLFKSKKLSTSFEIWSPKNKRKEKADGTYELRSIEIAGGALIYEDDENQPAFKNAKVLMMAKEKEDSDVELIYASKYKEDELICVGKPETSGAPIVQTALKIKCSNCNEEFETAEIANIKCPKCQAILNREGVMQYPPQVKDFKIMCPSCKVNNWLILSKNDDNAKLRCMSCSKEYAISFKTKNTEGLANRLSFVYTGRVTCYQCHTSIPIESTSKLSRREAKCPKCGLVFEFDTSHETFKNISTIEEIKKDTIEKSSDKGGKEMTKKQEIVKNSETVSEFEGKSFEETKEIIHDRLQTAKEEEPKKEDAPEEKKEEVKVEEKKEEVKVEEKKEEVKVEEKKEEPKEEKAPEEPKKEDEKVETVDVPKAEETPTPEVKEEAPKKEPVEPVAEPKVDVADAEEELEKLEDDVEKAKRIKEKTNSLLVRYPKVLRKALAKIKTIRKESVETASKKETVLKAGIKKAVKQYLDFKAKADEQIELYKTNARTIMERRAEVGESLTDEELMNEDKFERAKLELENAKIKANGHVASDIVSSSKKDTGYYSKMRKEIDDIACGRKEK